MAIVCGVGIWSNLISFKFLSLFVFPVKPIRTFKHCRSLILKFFLDIINKVQRNQVVMMLFVCVCVGGGGGEYIGTQDASAYMNWRFEFSCVSWTCSTDNYLHV